MSIILTTDVFCDECGNHIGDLTGRRAKTKEARRIAKDAGWKRVRADGRLLDRCPGCAQVSPAPAAPGEKA